MYKPKATQVNAYYPFGQAIAALAYSESPANRLKYNGKLKRSANPGASGELQGFSLNGRSLDWYDYGARFYDPTLGRWHSVDPLAEEFYSRTPYEYGANNPIRYLDPDGRIWVDTNGKPVYENGNYTKYAKEEHKRLGTALTYTEKGKEQFNQMVNSDKYIATSINEGTAYNDQGELVLGSMKPSRANFNNDKHRVEAVNDENNPYQITIYEGSIDLSLTENGKNSGLIKDGALGATLGHEIEHCSNENVQMQMDFKHNIFPGADKTVTMEKIEAKPEKVGAQIRQEFRDTQPKRIQPLEPKKIGQKR